MENELLSFQVKLIDKTIRIDIRSLLYMFSFPHCIFYKFHSLVLALSDHDQTFTNWSGNPYKPEACDDGNVPARSNGTEL